MTKLGVSGFYLWQKSIDQVSGLSWFVGPGASAGMFLWSGNSQFNASINGMAGLDYKIAKLPLVVAVDFSPRFYVTNSAGLYWGGALTLRYTLK